MVQTVYGTKSVSGRAGCPCQSYLCSETKPPDFFDRRHEEFEKC